MTRTTPPAVGDIILLDSAVFAKDTSSQSRTKTKVATPGVEMEEIAVTARRSSARALETPAAQIIAINDPFDFTQLQVNSNGTSSQNSFTGYGMTIRGLNSRGALTNKTTVMKFVDVAEAENYQYLLTTGTLSSYSLDADMLGVVGSYNFRDEPNVLVGTAGVSIAQGELAGCSGSFVTDTTLEIDKSVLSATATYALGIGDIGSFVLRGQYLMDTTKIGGTPAEGALLYSDGTKLSTAVSGEDFGIIDKISGSLALCYKF